MDSCLTNATQALYSIQSSQTTNTRLLEPNTKYMKNSKLFAGALCAMLLSASAFASDLAPERWSLTLGGTGMSDTKGSKNTSFGMDMSLGRTGKLILPLEAGIRQGVNYGEVSPSTDGVVLNTKGYVDWTLISYKQLDIFGGGNIGAVYGNTTMGWTAAPELGLRVWLNGVKTVAVVGRAEYVFNLSNCTVSPDQDTVKYFLGLAYRW
jgi:hypothetical protein